MQKMQNMQNDSNIVMFDLDLTLILTKESLQYVGHPLRNRMVEKAVELGVPAETFTAEDSRMPLVYNKSREIVGRAGFGEEKASFVMGALYELLLEHEIKEHEGCTLMPGATEALETLKKAVYKIGIVTTTSRSELLKIMEKFEIEKYVDLHVTRDDVGFIKPNPEPVLKMLKKALETFGSDVKKFCYVGDADYDLKAVRSACAISGVEGKFILINTRGYDEATISSLRPDALVNSLYELPSVLADLNKK